MNGQHAVADCCPKRSQGTLLSRRGCEFIVGCDKRSEFQGGVPARAIIEVRERAHSSQISAPAHREPCSARLSHPTLRFRCRYSCDNPGR
jgi:hypothetical protein